MPLSKPTVGQATWGGTLNTALDYLDGETVAETAARVAAAAAHVAAADPHAVYETSAEAAAKITAHEAAGDPHAVYETSAEAAAKITTHAGLADPHTGYVLESLLDAKGDLYAASAADTVARLAVGTNGQVLTADSAEATGIKWATAAAGAAPTLVRKTANQSVTSSAALIDDTHLFFAVAANETWAFEFVIFYTAATAGDIQVAITVPASGTSQRYGIHGLVPAVTTFTGDLTAESTSSGFALVAGGAAADALLSLKGMVVNGANAGNIRLQWAQNSINATATTVYLNSYLLAHKLA